MMQSCLQEHLSHNDLVNLLELSYRSLQCRNEDHLRTLFLDLKILFSFENLSCTQAKIPKVFLDRDEHVDVLDVSCPDGYLSTYMENGCHLTDATVCSFLSTLSPVSWELIDRQFGGDYPAARLANDFNMKCGWTHGALDLQTMNCTVISLGAPEIDENHRTRKILEYIIPFYAESYTRILKKESSSKHCLTSREIEVLHWIKEGKSSWEISMILNCSKRVIEFHVKNIKKKLNTVSRAQTVAVGLQCGIIEL